MHHPAYSLSDSLSKTQKRTGLDVEMASPPGAGRAAPPAGDSLSIIAAHLGGFNSQG
jgi:hypothetical protein